MAWADSFLCCCYGANLFGVVPWGNSLAEQVPGVVGVKLSLIRLIVQVSSSSLAFSSLLSLSLSSDYSLHCSLLSIANVCFPTICSSSLLSLLIMRRHLATYDPNASLSCAFTRKLLNCRLNRNAGGPSFIFPRRPGSRRRKSETVLRWNNPNISRPHFQIFQPPSCSLFRGTRQQQKHILFFKTTTTTTTTTTTSITLVSRNSL